MDHAERAQKAGATDPAALQQLLTEYAALAPTAADMKRKGWVAGQPLRINFKPYEWIDEETLTRSLREFLLQHLHQHRHPRIRAMPNFPQISIRAHRSSTISSRRRRPRQPK